MSQHTEEEKIIVCSGKSASLSLDSALAAAGGKKRYERSRVLLSEAHDLIEQAMDAMEES